VTGHRVAGAPGIYVRLDDPFEPRARCRRRRRGANPAARRREPDFTGLGKIAALGIKVSRHCTYHGVALNVAMDLQPFSAHQPLRLCRLADHGPFYNRRLRPLGRRPLRVLGQKLARATLSP
jgi:lipoyl(octanoyl) transferase